MSRNRQDRPGACSLAHNGPRDDAPAADGADVNARAGDAGRLGPGRHAGGWVLALAGPVVVTGALAREEPAASTLALGAMTLLAMTVASALVGGWWPALVSATTGTLALNWFLTAPSRTLEIDRRVDALALVIFVLVAVAVASVVQTAARRSAQAQAARAEADSLTALNTALLSGEHDPAALLAQLRGTFDLDGVSLLRRTGPDGWSLVAAVGDRPPARPDQAGEVADLAPDLVVATSASSRLPQHHRSVFTGFATHLAVAVERQELEQRRVETEGLREADRVRSALLAALSHDLRTPLASVKAAVSSLRSPDVRWSAEDEAELLATVEEGVDRLHAIMANLLDLGRLQVGAVQRADQVVGMDDVVSRTVSSMAGAGSVRLELPEELPPVRADAGLLDRVVENLVDNALRHAGPGAEVRVATEPGPGRVRLLVADRGPGVPDDRKEEMFRPFQRLGDRHGPAGVGLGLAVARGLTEAMGGTLRAEDTPGGGLTMVVELPAVAEEVPS